MNFARFDNIKNVPKHLLRIYEYNSRLYKIRERGGGVYSPFWGECVYLKMKGPGKPVSRSVITKLLRTCTNKYRGHYDGLSFYASISHSYSLNIHTAIF